MKQLAIIAFSLIIGNSAFAQIPNPGFEDHSALPTAFGQYTYCDHWNNANSGQTSPDYYHEYGAGDVNMPNTLGSVISAAEGYGAMGFVACGPESSNKREYISTQLESPMVVGEDYLISFRVSNGYITSNSYMGFGVNHLGISLSTFAYNQVGEDPMIYPTQFEIDSVFFNRDWEQYSFIITADQPYEHLTMGVFKPDHDLEFVSFEDNAQVVYYFVDDFFLMELPEDYDPTVADVPKGDTSSTDEPDPEDDLGEEGIQPFFIPNAFTPNEDGENDVFIPISQFPGTLEGYKFEIFSRWGELMFETDDMEQGWDGYYQGKLMHAGVYVWNITYFEFKGEQKFTRKFNGSVNLIR